jgi:hypothetical protein
MNLLLTQSKRPLDILTKILQLNLLTAKVLIIEMLKQVIHYIINHIVKTTRPDNSFNPSYHSRRESSDVKYRNNTLSKFHSMRASRINTSAAQEINTVESVLNSVHSSGYYVSAITRLTKQKKCEQRKNGGIKYNHSRLPPEPPLALPKYHNINFNNMRQIKHQSSHSEVSSGPARQQSLRDEPSDKARPSSSKNMLNSNTNHQEKWKNDIRKLGGKRIIIT